MWSIKKRKKIESCSYSGQIISNIATCTNARYGSLININPSVVKNQGTHFPYHFMEIMPLSVRLTHKAVCQKNQVIVKLFS